MYLTDPLYLSALRVDQIADEMQQCTKTLRHCTKTVDKITDTVSDIIRLLGGVPHDFDRYGVRSFQNRDFHPMFSPSRPVVDSGGDFDHFSSLSPASPTVPLCDRHFSSVPRVNRLLPFRRTLAKVSKVVSIALKKVRQIKRKKLLALIGVAAISSMYALPALNKQRVQPSEFPDFSFNYTQVQFPNSTFFEAGPIENISVQEPPQCEEVILQRRSACSLWQRGWTDDATYLGSQVLSDNNFKVREFVSRQKADCRGSFIPAFCNSMMDRTHFIIESLRGNILKMTTLVDEQANHCRKQGFDYTIYA